MFCNGAGFTFLFGFCFIEGWAAFDDFELTTEENCPILPAEAVPHIPSLGDCPFQHGVCDWQVQENGFKWKRITGNDTTEHAKPGYDHYGDPYGEKCTFFRVSYILLSFQIGF